MHSAACLQTVYVIITEISSSLAPLNLAISWPLLYCDRIVIQDYVGGSIRSKYQIHIVICKAVRLLVGDLRYLGYAVLN